MTIIVGIAIAIVVALAAATVGDPFFPGMDAHGY